MSGRAAAELEVGPGPLAADVAARVLGAVAARTPLPVDRVMEAQILLRTLLRRAPPHAGGRRPRLTFHDEPGGVRVEIGGFGLREAERLLASAGGIAGARLADRLSDGYRIESADGGARISLSFGTADGAPGVARA